MQSCTIIGTFRQDGNRFDRMSPQNARIPKRQVNVVQENPAAQELQRQLVALRLHGALSKLCTAIKLTNTLSLGRALRLWINKLRLLKSSIPAIVEDPVPAEVAVLTRAISGCRHKLRLQSAFRVSRRACCAICCFSTCSFYFFLDYTAHA